MISQTLKTLYLRDLNKLKEEILLYNNEENIWKIDQQILNSAGNLCLHLIGNLNTYIGAEFGNTGYVRNRPEEFSCKHISRLHLIEGIDLTISMIAKVVDRITETQLQEDYKLRVLPQNTSTEYFLVHLAMHLSYHLGQINYHRRLIDG